ncbi:hypothetical protein DEU56DRAFT_717092, partial [Suillus clintonianus]|uniref:uncharacterized protein n=1 Tax=Suillus clintonianus TaxID=1904413 RepID=UPI001B8712E4
CSGYQLEIPSGQSPYGCYPFGLHTRYALPWTCIMHDDTIFLVSKSCKKDVSANVLDRHGKKHTACFDCRRLENNEQIMGIHDRMHNGVHENSNYPFFSYFQLIETIKRLKGHNNDLQLKGLNSARQLVRKARTLDLMNRFKLAIAQSGGRYRLHAVVRVCVKHGDGIRTILDKMDSAHKQLFKPRDYDEEEFQLMMLNHSLGGGRVAHLQRKSHGLPSISATKRRLKAQPIIPSPGYPTNKELSHNLGIAFPDSLNSQEEEPVTIFADEIKVEERLRWDSAENKIIGVCREHGHSVSLDFVSIAEADAVLAALIDVTVPEERRVHLSSEATVIAARILSPDSTRNIGRPFVVSGTCKREDVAGQHRLLSGALAAFNQVVAIPRNKRVYSISSDGDSRRRQALARLTMSKELPTLSPIFERLSVLPLMNLRCGLDDVTGDFDAKHNFKRYRNSLLRKKGVTVRGAVITAAILKHHLSSLPKLTERRINALLYPNDKQDVPLAFSLLTAIGRLPDAAPDAAPTYVVTRRILQLLGKLYHHLLEPYTNVELSLQGQLEHLSAAAHITLALYEENKGNFIPVQLYYDTMTMVKNVFFCTAKVQASNPDGEFWIILLGTDPLEECFGDIRTMVGNDTNADTLQVSSRLNTALLCSTLLAIHPEWKCTPRRLALPSIVETPTGEVSQKYDHISPRSWKGDVHVQNVVLQTCWINGRRDAEEELRLCGIEPPFQRLEGGQGCDILAPFGGGKVVLLDGLHVGEREEDIEEVEEPSDGGARGPVNREVADIDLEPDLEDMVNTELVLADSSPVKSDAWIPLDSSQDHAKRIHKASILRMYSSPLATTGSKDRLRRNRGYSSYDDVISATQQSNNNITSNTDVLTIEDPIATLLRCNQQVFLAIGQVIDMRSGSNTVQIIPVDELQEPNVHIRVQIMQLATLAPEANTDSEGHDNNNVILDWEWTGAFEQLPGTSAARELDGRCVEPVNADVHLSTLQGTSTYRFSTVILRGLALLLFERLKNDVSSIPNVPLTPTFPYRSANGAACFVCEVDGEARGTLHERYRCLRCPAIAFEELGPKLIEHMGGHILFDQDLQDKHNVCGLCLSIGLCEIRLVRGAGGSEVVDISRSRCPNLFKIKLKNARKSTKHSPCTNTPVHCPYCDSNAAPVWKYSLSCHIDTLHPSANKARFEELWRLDDDERTQVSTKFKMKPRKRRQVTATSTLRISEQHSSRVAL